MMLMTFNSLFEIPLFVNKPLQAFLPLAFNSLFEIHPDSFRTTFSIQDVVFQFSFWDSLWRRYVQAHIPLAFFQFSFWDSLLLRIRQLYNIQVSFNSLFEIQIRLPARDRRSIAFAFQFSFWDSVVSVKARGIVIKVKLSILFLRFRLWLRSMALIRSSASFNSLFEIRLCQAVSSSSMHLPLSILFLRFKNGERAGRLMAEIMTFNSLFEIPW